jgi:hypothetical protein
MGTRFRNTVLMPSPTFDLANRVVGGRLPFLLNKWKSEGLNREQIATRLAEEHGLDFTGRTIDNWLHDLAAAS